MKKRMLSLALVMALALGLLPATASAAKSSATVTQAVPYQYANAHDFSEGLARVLSYDENARTYKSNFIDTTGKEVFSVYDVVGDFHDGRTLVGRNMGSGGGEGIVYSWGYIDKAGREVFWNSTEIYYSQGYGVDVDMNRMQFSENLAAIKRESKWGFIDTNGKEVIPCQYYSVKPFSDGLAAVQVKGGGEWGFIDKTGKLVIPFQYDSAEPFSNGLAVVQGSTGRVENGRTVYGYGVIDTAGNTAVPFGQYQLIGDYHDGLAEVRKDSGWGYIDTAGREVIPCQYKEVKPFSEGLAAVATNSGWGYVDLHGNEIIPCQYEEVEPFSEGLAAVKTKSGWGYIDLHGDEVIPCQHGEARQLSEGLLAVDLDGKWGFVRVEGLPSEPKAAQIVANDVTPDKAADNTAYAATQTVMVDGQSVTFNAYALKDANGYATNYIKLRDVADVLNGSSAQFQVGWDGQISITTQTAYTPNGTEMVKNFEGDQTYSVNQNTVTVNGKQVNLEAITLSDATGGYTYFKLRDLGEALGFTVDWNAQEGIIIRTQP